MKYALRIKVTERQQEIIWYKVFLLLTILSGFLWGLYYIFSGQVGRSTAIFTFAFFLIGGIGTGPGAHRLFTHRSYKVTHGLKVFIIFCNQISGLYSIVEWVRIHRVHHKFGDSGTEPADILRGLFYECVGFGLLEYTPEVKYELDRIYMDDIMEDKDLIFQFNNYPFLYASITLGLPTLIPYLLWNESIYIAIAMNLFRMFLNLFQQIIGNGFVHYNGTKPYDRHTTAIDNSFYNLLTLGEGYHNFHHAFPFDYRSSEYFELAHLASASTLFIDLCAWIGLVSDRKVAPPQMIENRILRTGDGSHPLSKKLAATKIDGKKDKSSLDVNENFDDKNTL